METLFKTYETRWRWKRVAGFHSDTYTAEVPSRERENAKAEDKDKKYVSHRQIVNQ